MTIYDELVSGRDISGRDDLLTLTKNAARSIGKALGATVTTIAISFSAFAATSLWSSGGRLAATVDTPIDVSDTLLELVWKVRSDNIQPNVTARHTAMQILAKMEDARVTPDRIVADPDGGVALYVFGRGRDDRHGRILAANEGDIIALCVDYQEQLHDAWQVDAESVPDAVSKIRSFILAGKDRTDAAPHLAARAGGHVPRAAG
jgi:hypothetical protein